MNRVFKISAIQMPIWFNNYGDHDHDGMMYILDVYKPILNYVKKVQALPDGPALSPLPPALAVERTNLINQFGLTGDTLRINEWLPATKADAKKPHPLVSPLVIRAAKGDIITIHLKNELNDGRKASIHLMSGEYGVESDGTEMWQNTSSLALPGQTKQYNWTCSNEGVFLFNDAGDFRGDEAGTNAHGLFGALIVEPEGSRWTDPENGKDLLSGLYADVHQRTPIEIRNMRKPAYPNRDNPKVEALTKQYPDERASFREL